MSHVEKQTFILEKKIGEGVFDVSLSPLKVRRVQEATERSNWHKSTSKCRLYYGDGMTYETDGAAIQKIVMTKILSCATVGDLVELTLERQKLPFHAFSSDRASLRYVADQTKTTYRIAPGCSLVIEVTSKATRAYFIHNIDVDVSGYFA